MSLQEWRKEFYPEDARLATPENAIAMSLRKWRGLRKEALVRYGVTHLRSSGTGTPQPLYRYLISVGDEDLFSNGDADAFSGEGIFFIDSQTCSLCHLYDRPLGARESERCKDCPLSLVRGGIRCDADQRIRGEDITSPYHVYCQRGDPEPMIAWLEKALQLEDTTKERSPT